MPDRERPAGSNARLWYELQVMALQNRGSAGGGVMRKMFHVRFAGCERWPIGDTARVMIARGPGRTGTFISARGTETDEERRRGAAVVSGRLGSADVLAEVRGIGVLLLRLCHKLGYGLERRSEFTGFSVFPGR